MYKWNKTFQKILEIKHLYETKFGEIPYDNFEPEKDVFSFIVKKLNIEEYLNWLPTLVISSYKDFLLFNYNIVEGIEEIWENPNSLNREARGLVIDLKNEEIVICPFKKFFNIGEVAETKFEVILEKIKKASVFEVTNKLDGSMITASFYKNEILLSGSKCCNPEISWRIADNYKYLNNNENYKRMISENEGKTFIFESISRRDPHIVFYDSSQHGLYLIGIRDKYTGIESSYKEVLEIAKKYGVLVTTIESYTFDELLSARNKFKANEKEGWVLSIDGFRVKLKCEDFILLHKVYNNKSLGKMLIQSIADGNVDDVLSIIPEKYRKTADTMVSTIYDYAKQEEILIRNYYEKAPKENKENLVEWTKKNVPKKYFPNIINIYEGKPLYILKSRSGKYVKDTEIGLDKVLISNYVLNPEE